MGQVLISAVVVVACLAGLTYWATKMISDHPAIKAYLKAKAAQATADANKTEEESHSEELKDSGETEDSKNHKDDKPKQDKVIISAFAVLNDSTAPGDLQFTNPKLPVLMSELNDRWNYIKKREAELDELEAHVAEQLQAMQWHTNQIIRNRIELNRHFEDRINLIEKQEQARLREMAQIYETLLAPDQPDGPSVIRQILRANMEQDAKLNAKVFQYISVTNQANIIRTLLSAEASDAILYQNIIQNRQKTMTVDAIESDKN
tara:strand:- start:105 stop:890 length:786 start_codon:yes stop_codon:yes gene_type:complete